MDEFEQRLQETNVSAAILRLSPNGIVLVDGGGRIRLVNDAFRRMFASTEEQFVDHPIADVIRSDCFDRARQTEGQLSVNGTVPELDVHYRAGIFPVNDDGMYCGIFTDRTTEERAHRQLREMKAQMLSRAQEVIQHQMSTAQEIAGLLGETTAETKVLLVNLMDLFRQEDSE